MKIKNSKNKTVDVIDSRNVTINVTDCRCVTVNITDSKKITVNITDSKHYTINAIDIKSNVSKMENMNKTFNPCDECQYSYTKNNQETGMCDICEFKKTLQDIKTLSGMYEKLSDKEVLEYRLLKKIGKLVEDER